MLGSDLNPGREERVLVVDRWAPSLPLGSWDIILVPCSFLAESVPCWDIAAAGHPQDSRWPSASSHASWGDSGWPSELQPFLMNTIFMAG